MDPQATLKMIQDFLSNRETGPDVDVWCYNLFLWLASGGFAPVWEDCPLATSYYKCRCVHLSKGRVEATDLGYASKAELFLDWFNNFMSYQGFADYHDIRYENAVLLIGQGRIEHESQFVTA